MGTENRTILSSLDLDAIAKRVSEVHAAQRVFSKEAPLGCQGFDIRRLSDVAPGTEDVVFLDFKAPKGFEAVVTHYAIFCDGQLASQMEFIPRMKGIRMFPYHGTPNETTPYKTPFRISLGIGTDLSDNCLIEAPLIIPTEYNLTWSITNHNANTQSMGVRMKGYLRDVTTQTKGRFGG